MACSSRLGMCGRSSRKRQTPLWSRFSRDVRRFCQRDFSAAGSKADASEVHPGKENSNRSPQVVQRKSWPAESGVAAQEMQRKRETVSRIRVVDNGYDPVQRDGGARHKHDTARLRWPTSIDIEFRVTTRGQECPRYTGSILAG